MVLLNGKYFLEEFGKIYPLYFCSLEERRRYCFERFGNSVEFEIDKEGFEKFAVLNGQHVAILGFRICRKNVPH